MEKKKIVIFGTGQMGELVYSYFCNDLRYEVVAFSVDRSCYTSFNDFLYDLPVVPFEDVENQYPPSHYDMFIAIGYSKLNKIRAAKYYEAKLKGYNLVTYIHSSVQLLVPGSRGAQKIGDNCFILENQVIQPFVTIGNNVFLWSGNHIGHHSIIEDHCFIASHVVVSGNVHIKPYCFIGVNATLRNEIIIQEQTIIGAGAVILKNTEPGDVYKSMETPRAARHSSLINL